MTPRVLVVDDDTALAEMIGIVLRTEGFEPVFCADGAGAVAAFRESKPDLVLLDLMLPGMDGIEVCGRIRAESGTPIIMLTAKSDTADVVKGLESGADDYMVKPFALQELAARLEVLGRRGKGSKSRLLQLADLTYNLDTLTISRAGKQIQLNPIGLKLLQSLMEASPSVVTRQELETRVWGEELPDSDSLRVHIHGLRAAIDKPFDKPLIQTRHGIGYRMVDPDALPT